MSCIALLSDLQVITECPGCLSTTSHMSGLLPKHIKSSKVRSNELLSCEDEYRDIRAYFECPR
jgi:hypothetical protein